MYSEKKNNSVTTKFKYVQENVSKNDYWKMSQQKLYMHNDVFKLYYIYINNPTFHQPAFNGVSLNNFYYLFILLLITYVYNYLTSYPINNAILNNIYFNNIEFNIQTYINYHMRAIHLNFIGYSHKKQNLIKKNVLQVIIVTGCDSSFQRTW